jgi:hypothetical protein
MAEQPYVDILQNIISELLKLLSIPASQIDVAPSLTCLLDSTVLLITAPG